MELNELTRERLTDDRTYQQVKEIVEGHARAGRTPDIDQLRYIKLAEYERMEEKDMNDEIEQAYREGYNHGIKRGYTEILTKYWNEKKIYVECVSTSNNIIIDNTNTLKENGFNKWKFIIYNVM